MDSFEFLIYLIGAIGVMWLILNIGEFFPDKSDRWNDPKGVFEWGSGSNYLLILFILCLLAFVCFGG